MAPVPQRGRWARLASPVRGPGGRPSVLKTAVLIALVVPAAATAADYLQGALGPRPMTEAIHALGLWATRWMFAALAVTPLALILAWPGLFLLRRMLGVAAFAYAALHLLGYVADQGFALGTVAAEIALRFYLTIGFAALLGLAALAATSTDGMMRRLGGRRWRRLHQLVYPIALLAIVHFFIQSKADVYEPTVMAGLLLWLLGARAVARLGRARVPPLWTVAALGLATAALTALGEALYFHLRTGVAPWRVLAANLSPAIGLRPAAVVLLITGAVTILAATVRVVRRALHGPRHAPAAAA